MLERIVYDSVGSQTRLGFSSLCNPPLVMRERAGGRGGGIMYLAALSFLSPLPQISADKNLQTKTLQGVRGVDVCAPPAPSLGSLSLGYLSRPPSPPIPRMWVQCCREPKFRPFNSNGVARKCDLRKSSRSNWEGTYSDSYKKAAFFNVSCAWLIVFVKFMEWNHYLFITNIGPQSQSQYHKSP